MIMVLVNGSGFWVLGSGFWVMIMVRVMVRVLVRVLGGGRVRARHGAHTFATRSRRQIPSGTVSVRGRVWS